MPRRKVEAIAAVCILVLLGWALKPATKTQADSLDTLPTEVKKPQATSTARVLQRQKQTRQIRPESYDLKRFPINTDTASHWRHLLWTTAVVEPRETFVAEALNEILAMTSAPSLSQVELQTVDQAMKVSTQLYLSDPSFYGFVGQRFMETIERSPDAEWVAVALSGLAKGKLSSTELLRLSSQVKARFPGWADNVFLQTTIHEIEDNANGQTMPPLADLLKWEIAPKQLHLYVLCRGDRRVLCRAVLKDRDGNFLRHEQDGKLWSVPLLLESIHDLGWNFTRGQTPQGIYRIEGSLHQPDDEFFRAYGQFPLVNLYVPFEAGAKQFLPNQPGTFAGEVAAYQSLLPPAWRNHRPLQQSYWAGKAGRGLFRIHGSGESPDFFRGKDKSFPASYNWNPTIGCLSARELYNDKGQLIHADMPGILKALQIVGGKDFTGYLVVVDLPADAPEPLSLETIEGALAKTARAAGKKPLKAAKPSVQLVVAQSSSLPAIASSQTVSRQISKLTQHLSRLGKTGWATTPNPASTQTTPAKTSSRELDPLPTAY